MSNKHENRSEKNFAVEEEQRRWRLEKPGLGKKSGMGLPIPAVVVRTAPDTSETLS
jgi:hypothetical protein